MKKLMTIAALAAICAGCHSPKKVRDIELKGMYVNGYSEVVAIGQGRLTSIPGEREALAAHYEEDTAWLSPSTKTHKLDIFLVGTNSVSSSQEIIGSICKAFSEVAPQVAATHAANAGGTTVLDVIKNGGVKSGGVESKGSTTVNVPPELKAKISEYFVSRGGNANAAKIYYDAANVLTMSDGTTTVECTADGACRECGDK